MQFSLQGTLNISQYLLARLTTLLPCSQISDQGWKWLAVTDTLAYNAEVFMIVAKCFTVQPPQVISCFVQNQLHRPIHTAKLIKLRLKIVKTFFCIYPLILYFTTVINTQVLSASAIVNARHFKHKLVFVGKVSNPFALLTNIRPGWKIAGMW